MLSFTESLDFYFCLTPSNTINQKNDWFNYPCGSYPTTHAEDEVTCYPYWSVLNLYLFSFRRFVTPCLGWLLIICLTLRIASHQDNLHRFFFKLLWFSSKSRFFLGSIIQTLSIQTVLSHSSPICFFPLILSWFKPVDKDLAGFCHLLSQIKGVKAFLFICWCRQIFSKISSRGQW